MARHRSHISVREEIGPGARITRRVANERTRMFSAGTTGADLPDRSEAVFPRRCRSDGASGGEPPLLTRREPHDDTFAWSDAHDFAPELMSPNRLLSIIAIRDPDDDRLAHMLGELAFTDKRSIGAAMMRSFNGTRMSDTVIGAAWLRIMGRRYRFLE
jgi:hypothetical protein